MFILKKSDANKKLVRKPFRGQHNEKYVSKVQPLRDFPDEDPDLEDESAEGEAISRSRNVPSILKPRNKKES
jgi:hypothetical protein